MFVVRWARLGQVSLTVDLLGSLRLPRLNDRMNSFFIESHGLAGKSQGLPDRTEPWILLGWKLGPGLPTTLGTRPTARVR